MQQFSGQRVTSGLTSSTNGVSFQRFFAAIVLIATIWELFSWRQCSWIVTVLRYLVSGRRLSFAAKVRVVAGFGVSLTMLELPSKLATRPVAGPIGARHRFE
jgi:hypothetical protein